MTQGPIDLGRWATALFTVCIAGVLLTGCETEPPMPEGKIRIIDPGPLGDATARPAREPVNWRSRRIVVRLEHPVEELWELTDETILPDVSRAVWNGNGMRVGLLSANQADEFSEALGRVMEVRDTDIRNFDEPHLLRRSRPLRAEFFADLTVPPLPENKEYFTRGRLQLLMSSRPRGDGSALLTLLPQHHVPEVSFVPRTAAEKLLDGRIYDELGIELNIGTSEALLIGFYQPAPPDTEGEEVPAAPAPSDPETAGPDTPQPRGGKRLEAPGVPSQPLPPGNEVTPPPDGVDEEQGEKVIEEIDEPQSASDETPDIPLNLGRGLFTTGVRDRDLQILYLLRPLP
ncbi:MAG: hypothetical protein AAF333_06665 [Planctomycetota bacterium]